MGLVKTGCEQSNLAKVKKAVSNGYLKAGVVVGTVMVSSGASAALAQPDVTEATTYIDGLTSGAGFEIATAGLMMTIGIRGLKRIRSAF